MYSLNSDSDLIKANACVSEVPYDMRDGATLDILNAVKGLRTKMKNGTLTGFNMKFRCRK